MEDWSYSRILRAVGQSLEELNLQDFLIKCDNQEFVVRGYITEPLELRWFDRLLGRRAAHTQTSVELRYSLLSILELQSRGETKRKNPDQIPDYYRLSQTLRNVGGLVDKRFMQLESLQRKGDSLYLELRERTGEIRSEKHSIGALEYYFQRCCLQRFNNPPGK